MRVSPRTVRGPERVRRRTLICARPDLQRLESRCLLSVDAFQPTADEQFMLALINRARANPAAEGQRLVAIAQNDPVIQAATRNWDLNTFAQVISSFAPEPPLAFNTRLVEAARDHNDAMLAANNQFHSPTGYLNNAQVAVASDGQAYYPTEAYGWATGENIFAYSANIPAGSSTTSYVNYFEEGFFLDWGNPDFGHLKNLLAPGPAEAAPGTLPFSEVGVGLMTGATPTNVPNPNNPIAANRGLNVGPALITEEFGWHTGDAFLTGSVSLDRDNNQFYTSGEGIGSVVIKAVGQNGEGTFQTQTWDSGGYSLALPPGTYAIEATGGNLSAPQTTTITIGKDNVAWDVRLPGPAPSPANAAREVGAASIGPVSTPTTTKVTNAGSLPGGPVALAQAQARKRHIVHAPAHRHAPHANVRGQAQAQQFGPTSLRRVLHDTGPRKGDPLAQVKNAHQIQIN